MCVELDVDLRPARPEPEVKSVADPEVVTVKRHRFQEDRLLRRIALAQAIEARIAVGEFKDMAEAAKRCRVSRARLSTIMNRRG